MKNMHQGSDPSHIPNEHKEREIDYASIEMD